MPLSHRLWRSPPPRLVEGFRSVTANDSPTELASDDWMRLFNAHYHLVIRFVMHSGACQSDAQDAAQEAFAEAWRLVSSKPDDWLKINCRAAWIRTVALRRYGRPPGARRRPLIGGNEIPDLPVPGPGHDEATMQAQDLLRAMRVLTDEERRVVAFTFDDIPTADIALVLDISQQRVRDVKKAARTKLKRELGRNTEDEGRQ